MRNVQLEFKIEKIAHDFVTEKPIGIMNDREIEKKVVWAIRQGIIAAAQETISMVE